MSFSRPTLAELVQRTRNDTLSRLSTDEALRRADAEVYARVFSGVAHGLYGFIDWVSRQILPDTSDLDILIRQASIWGVEQKPAAAATGSVTFSVQPGSVIPAGTLLQALDGQQYATTADAVVSLPNATAPVEAVAPGAAGNRAAGENMTLVSPVVGVQSVVVAGEMSGGADLESEDDLRGRLIARIQQPPQGGCAYDYEAWALEIEGVTRAWVSPQELGLGTVTVRFVRDNDGTGSAIIPDAAEVAAVQSYIDSHRPVTAQVTVVAPAAVPLNFQIQGLTPNNATVQAAVQAELQDLLLREAVPGGTILLSHIRAAISAAAGETDYVLLSPSANVTNTTGNMSTMGTITWS